MFEDKCVWSALYPISNHSHIRQLQFATHAFSQQVLQQAVQISICQCPSPTVTVLSKEISLDYGRTETKAPGVYIDEFLSWNNHIEVISKKISSGIGAVRKLKPHVDRL